MRKLLFALSAVAIVSVACQKEVSLEVPDSDPGSGGGGNTTQGLLRRTAFVAGADSVITEYTYDASNRLATFTYTSTGGGNQFKRIVRNNAGIITAYITKSAELIGLGIDSLVTNVFYDNTNNQYKDAVSTISFGGSDYSDSTAFTYSGGNLIRKESFAKVGPAPYTAYQKVEYTFGSGNTLSEMYFDINNSGNYELLGTYNYAYDAKLNPIKLGVEGMIVLDDATYFSNNNVTNMSYVDAADPSSDFSLATTFTYNSADKPSGGTAVETPGSGSYTLRYYYN
ncbi:MAG TPA: hypothetical protein VGN63_06565 [Flavisolibacter sp.]|jgi:hypothetical protein|nr:hypothetical protein [Flavisolibacter sp.]